MEKTTKQNSDDVFLWVYDITQLLPAARRRSVIQFESCKQLCVSASSEPTGFLSVPLLRSVTDRNPVGSDDGVSANLLCLKKK